MPRELITVQVGQCGNQIGRRFWQQALAEHASAVNSNGVFDECMSTFFTNVDPRSGAELPCGEPIAALKARAVLVDMEDGVVNETLKGSLSDLFERRQLVTDVYGAGNNWAHGYGVYGPQYRDALLESFRVAAEKCESLQSFFVMHSMGGGTGSGLGTYILSLLEDAYPTAFRFVAAVMPSKDDDVVTSPYNTTLALDQLTHHADCVLPVDNASLFDITSRESSANSNGLTPRRASISSTSNNNENIYNSKNKDKGKAGFDAMNGLVASLLMDLTASSRFPGSLNVDLNEITTNLVPFPRLHYIVPALAPLRLNPPSGSTARRRSTLSGGTHVQNIVAGAPTVKTLFDEATLPSHQLVSCDIRRSRILACGLLLRGDVTVSEANAGVEKLRGEIDMVRWNTEGFKVGLCATPPPGLRRSLLFLSNSCAFGDTLNDVRSRFNLLYHRKAMVHHYTQYIEKAHFDEALSSLSDLIDDYERVGKAPGVQQMPHRRRSRPAF